MAPTPIKMAVTGHTGFIGRLVVPTLVDEGHQIVGYDKYSQLSDRWLNHRFFLPETENGMTSVAMKLEIALGQLQKRIRPFVRSLSQGCETMGIRSDPSLWAQRFEGCQVVLHLAAIPHPNVKGLSPKDYESINYDGAVNIYQAARQAGVQRFVYASSCQAYFISRFTGWKRFPVLEEDADEIHAICRPHDYGFFKWKFERYLLENSARDNMVSPALRLEMPGLWGANSDNLYTQTSVDNLQQAVFLACTRPLEKGAHILNIADDWTPESIVNITRYVKLRWPGVAGSIQNNSSLLSCEKAKKLLGYRPIQNGHYYPKRCIF